jgi:hypothetical protein
LPKNYKIQIKCTKATWHDFRTFVAENDFRSQEEALRFLLDQARNLGLRPGRYY